MQWRGEPSESEHNSAHLKPPELKNMVEEAAGNLDQTCPFGHSSTKHLSNTGVLTSYQETVFSNLARTALLSKLAGFIDGEQYRFQYGSSLPFADIAAKAHAINDRAPACIADILPIGADRSFEEVWRNFSKAGSPMSAFLSFAHAEACRFHDHHGRAAKHVVSNLLTDLRADFEYVARMSVPEEVLNNQSDPLHKSSTSIVPLSQQDVISIQAYQLLQERWLYKSDLRRLNEDLKADPDLIQTILDVQQYLCEAIGRFILAYPEHSGSKVTFGEIALWDPAGNKFIPSSRFLKAVIHNTGPWLLGTKGMSRDVRLLEAIGDARKFGAFDQQICIFSRNNSAWAITGTERKVCPAKTSLMRMISATLTKG